MGKKSLVSGDVLYASDFLSEKTSVVTTFVKVCYKFDTKRHHHQSRGQRISHSYHGQRLVYKRMLTTTQ